MTPFEQPIMLASERLLEMGYEPLDEREGRLGGERHGVWDWTWVSHRRLAAACLASVYAVPARNDFFDTEVWAHLASDGATDRSLVRRFLDLPGKPDADLADQLAGAVTEAGRRAFYLDPGRR